MQQDAQIGLQPQPLLQRQVGAGPHRLFDIAAGDGRGGGDFGSQRGHRTIQLRGGNHPVDQSDVQSLGSGQHPAGQQQLARPTGANQSRQPLRRAVKSKRIFVQAAAADADAVGGNP